MEGRGYTFIFDKRVIFDKTVKAVVEWAGCMTAQELGPRGDARISLPNLSPLIARWNDQFVAWIRENGVSASADQVDSRSRQFLHKLDYIMEVSALLRTESIKTGDLGIVLLVPLCNIFVQHHYPQEELQPDGALETGSQLAAQEWLTTHPEKTAAQKISMLGLSPAKKILLLGLSATVGTHLTFITGMCREAQEETA